MKGRVSKRKANELDRKKWKRMFRTHVSNQVIDGYLLDETNPIHADDFMKSFSEDQTGTKKSANMLIGFLSDDLNVAMKQGIKAALKDGVPGVLVTQAYFDDLEANPGKLDLVETTEDAAQYVAGCGQGGAGVGVLYVYKDEVTNPYWLCVHNHRRQQMNGMLNRNKDEIEVSVTQKLPGFSPGSNVVKAIRGTPDFKLLK